MKDGQTSVQDTLMKQDPENINVERRRTEREKSKIPYFASRSAYSSGKAIQSLENLCSWVVTWVVVVSGITVWTKDALWEPHIFFSFIFIVALIFNPCDD